MARSQFSTKFQFGMMIALLLAIFAVIVTAECPHAGQYSNPLNNGECECPTNASQDPTTQACICPGQTSSVTASDDTQSCTCPSDISTKNADNTCACNVTGAVFDPVERKCDQCSNPNFVPGATKCECPSGTTVDPADDEKCVCDDTRLDFNPTSHTCVCPADQKATTDGSDEPCQCKNPEQIIGADNACTCPNTKGFVADGSNTTCSYCEPGQYNREEWNGFCVPSQTVDFGVSTGANIFEETITVKFKNYAEFVGYDFVAQILFDGKPITAGGTVVATTVGTCTLGVTPFANCAVTLTGPRARREDYSISASLRNTSTPADVVDLDTVSGLVARPDPVLLGIKYVGASQAPTDIPFVTTNPQAIVVSGTALTISGTWGEIDGSVEVKVFKNNVAIDAYTQTFTYPGDITATVDVTGNSNDFHIEWEFIPTSQADQDLDLGTATSSHVFSIYPSCNDAITDDRFVACTGDHQTCGEAECVCSSGFFDLAEAGVCTDVPFYIVTYTNEAGAATRLTPATTPIIPVNDNIAVTVQVPDVGGTVVVTLQSANGDLGVLAAQTIADSAKTTPATLTIPALPTGSINGLSLKFVFTPSNGGDAETTTTPQFSVVPSCSDAAQSFTTLKQTCDDVTTTCADDSTCACIGGYEYQGTDTAPFDTACTKIVAPIVVFSVGTGDNKVVIPFAPGDSPVNIPYGGSIDFTFTSGSKAGSVKYTCSSSVPTTANTASIDAQTTVTESIEFEGETAASDKTAFCTVVFTPTDGSTPTTFTSQTFSLHAQCLALNESAWESTCGDLGSCDEEANECDCDVNTTVDGDHVCQPDAPTASFDVTTDTVLVSKATHTITITGGYFAGSAVVGFYIGDELQGTASEPITIVVGTETDPISLTVPSIESDAVSIKVVFTVVGTENAQFNTEFDSAVFKVIPTCHADAAGLGSTAEPTSCNAAAFFECKADSTCGCADGYMWETEEELACVLEPTTPAITIVAQLSPTAADIPLATEQTPPSPVNMNSGAVLAVTIDGSKSAVGTLQVVVAYYPRLTESTFSTYPLVLFTYPTVITVDPKAATTTQTISITAPSNIQTTKAYLQFTFTSATKEVTVVKSVPFAIYPACYTTTSTTATSTCGEHGQCAVSNVCICETGYSGAACDITTTESNDWCSSCNQEHLSKCTGTSEPTARSTPCQCKDKWGGMLCEDSNACLTKALTGCGYNKWKGVYPTQADGTCGTTCQCFDNWQGDGCQTCGLQCKNGGEIFKGCEKCGCKAGYDASSNCACLSAALSFTINGSSEFITKFDGNFTSTDNVYNPLLSFDVGLANLHTSYQGIVAALLNVEVTAITNMTIVPAGTDKKSTQVSFNIKYNCDDATDQSAAMVTQQATSFESMSSTWTTAAPTLAQESNITGSLTFTSAAAVSDVTSAESVATLPSDDEKYDPNSAFAFPINAIVVIVISALLM